MDFFIRQHSEQPLLLMELVLDDRLDYRKFYQLLQSAAITFSMRDERGRLKIANKEALIVKKPKIGDPITKEDEYYIAYKFTESDTNETGLFEGQFLIEFLNEDETQFAGKFRAPVADTLNIYIKESFTKSEPIQQTC